MGRTMHGTRDAVAIGEETRTAALLAAGFVQGRSSPCTFHHPGWDVTLVVHGGDFTAPGTDASLNLNEAAMLKAFECDLRGRLGEEKQ